MRSCGRLLVSMFGMKQCMLWALFVLAVGSVAPSQKAVKKTPDPASFVLDRNKPFVYIEFLRIGKREPLREEEVSEGVWLKIVNNCRVSIEFMAYGGNGDEAIPNEEVVYDEYQGPVITTPDGKQSPPPQKRRSEMPGGYMYDVGGSLLLAPGKSLSFSLPINHVAADWHIEIPFDFVLPSTRSSRPKMSALFFLNDVPEEYKAQFQQHDKK